jgi:hypothetical protein
MIPDNPLLWGDRIVRFRTEPTDRGMGPSKYYCLSVLKRKIVYLQPLHAGQPTNGMGELASYYC